MALFFALRKTLSQDTRRRRLLRCCFDGISIVLSALISIFTSFAPRYFRLALFFSFLAPFYTWLNSAYIGIAHVNCPRSPLFFYTTPPADWIFLSNGDCDAANVMCIRSRDTRVEARKLSLLFKNSPVYVIEKIKK